VCEAATINVNITVEPVTKSIYQVRKMASVFADDYAAFKADPMFGPDSELFKAWKAARARKEVKE